MDDRLQLYRSLSVPSETRILFYVVDGLGGLPGPGGGGTELESADTPCFDRLAREGECGLTTPVLAGITPGSGPAHLALFGYDPVRYRAGRGVLAALGVGAELSLGDVAARINFCTLDGDGNVTDRRAGRVGDEVGRPLAERLDGIELDDDVHVSVRHVKQYRACVIFRGEGLDGRVADTDPQETGVPPRRLEARDPDAERTAELARRFVQAAMELLADQERANGILLRGFDSYEPLPSLPDLYGLDAVAVAGYPMYRGVARLAGMEIHPVKDEPRALAAAVGAEAERDFVFLHYKATDSRGEDGDHAGKVAAIEEADALLSGLVRDFDVVMVTGDHSTPWSMRSHSWHPVPVLVWGGPSRAHPASSFGEGECARGSLGRIASIDILPLVLAHADRLKKFGA